METRPRTRSTVVECDGADLYDGEEEMARECGEDSDDRGREEGSDVEQHDSEYDSPTFFHGSPAPGGHRKICS